MFRSIAFNQLGWRNLYPATYLREIRLFLFTFSDILFPYLLYLISLCSKISLISVDSINIFCWRIRSPYNKLASHRSLFNLDSWSKNYLWNYSEHFRRAQSELRDQRSEPIIANNHRYWSFLKEKNRLEDVEGMFIV